MEPSSAMQKETGSWTRGVRARGVEVRPAGVMRAGGGRGGERSEAHALTEIVLTIAAAMTTKKL
jgi:hypothetical protein